MAVTTEIEQWLQQGITAAKAGQLEQARFRLLDVVEKDHANEIAWYWLYQIFDHVDDKRTCLENLIIINPKNKWAKQELLALLEQTAPPPPQVGPSPRSKESSKKAPPSNISRPITLRLITAFWFGISLILLGGGIISAGEWLFSGLFQRSAAANGPVNLAISVFFIILGVMGFCVASALYFQSMLGFYGSILLALGLLLVGPIFSLIANPPNYLAMACTGGIAGMIVLLTLASQPGFKDS